MPYNFITELKKIKKNIRQIFIHVPFSFSYLNFIQIHYDKPLIKDNSRIY